MQFALHLPKSNVEPNVAVLLGARSRRIRRQEFCGRRRRADGRICAVDSPSGSRPAALPASQGRREPGLSRVSSRPWSRSALGRGARLSLVSREPAKLSTCLSLLPSTMLRNIGLLSGRRSLCLNLLPHSPRSHAWMTAVLDRGAADSSTNGAALFEKCRRQAIHSASRHAEGDTCETKTHCCHRSRSLVPTS